MGTPMGLQWATRDGEPVPLNCLLPTQSSVFDWVLHKVKEIQCCVGMKCGGFKEKFMGMLTVIEVGHNQLKKSGSKKQRELKGLMWPLNYKGSSSCECKVDIVCLQETKLKFITRRLIRSIRSCPYVDWAYLASDGDSGGVLVMWDRRMMEKIEEFIGEFTLACSFKSVEDNFLWAFVGIYGPNLDSTRRFL
ncbi:hypothetical protein CIPAW_07G216700 [Carya illinoinensis]|uniref:Uncharacterized protein n=1 Tax=Carya illinoinensis TaxID=32201 RepID=A0A8T1Q554_CARIL|nr:hypothetical protein CIPAW_07G216700 [Carya illinoinensis]